MARKESPGEKALERHLNSCKVGYQREVRFSPPRMFRADFIITRKDGARLIVEVQGGAWSRGRHGRGKGMQDDGEKSALAAIAGFQLMSLTTEQVTAGKAVAWILEWLAAA